MELILSSLVVLLVLVLVVTALVVAAVAGIVWALRRRRRSNPGIVSLIEAQAGRQQTQVIAIEAEGKGLGLTVYIRNRGESSVLVLCGAGTLFLPPDPGLGARIAARDEAIAVAPGSVGRLDVEAPGLEPHGRPLPPWGKRGYRAEEMTSDGNVLQVLDALQRLEAELAEHVQSLEVEGVHYRSMRDDLTILATYCTVVPDGAGVYRARVAARVIQHALWQVTAGLDLDGLANSVLKNRTAKNRAVLVAEVLAANVLLHEAGLEPSAVK